MKNACHPLGTGAAAHTHTRLVWAPPTDWQTDGRGARGSAAMRAARPLARCRRSPISLVVVVLPWLLVLQYYLYNAYARAVLFISGDADL